MAQPTTSPKKQTRGAVHKEGSIFIGLWIPKADVERIDRAVKILDTDRSKFIRGSIRKRVGEVSAA